MTRIQLNGQNHEQEADEQPLIIKGCSSAS